MTALRRFARPTIYAVLAVGLVILFLQIDIDETIYYLNAIDPAYLLLGIMCQILTMALLAVQWSSMVGMAGFQPDFVQSFLMNSVGNVADALNPGVKVGGELFRYDQLRKRFRMMSEDSILVVALQKIVSLSAFFVLTLVSLAYVMFGKDREDPLILSSAITVVVFGVIAALLAYVFLRPGFLDKMVDKLRLKAESKEKVHRFLENYRQALERFKSDKHKILIQFLLAVFIWSFYAVKLYVVCRAFDIEINILMTGAITYISYMIGMIPLLPGSVGSFEAGMVALFGLAGVEPTLAVGVSVVFRIVTFWFESAFCAVVLGVERLLKGRRRCVE